MWIPEGEVVTCALLYSKVLGMMPITSYGFSKQVKGRHISNITEWSSEGANKSIRLNHLPTVKAQHTHHEYDGNCTAWNKVLCIATKVVCIEKETKCEEDNSNYGNQDTKDIHYAACFHLKQNQNTTQRFRPGLCCRQDSGLKMGEQGFSHSYPR